MSTSVTVPTYHMVATQSLLDDCVAALDEGDLLESELCWDEFKKNTDPKAVTQAFAELPEWAREKLAILIAFTAREADLADVTHRGLVLENA
jgi:hypothetical protein